MCDRVRPIDREDDLRTPKPATRMLAGTMVAAIATLWSSNAFAAGGGLSDESFQVILGLLGLFAVGFLVTHQLSEWVARRFGVETGVEYVVFGMLVGPVLGWLAHDQVSQVAPALVLCQGSLGLLVGIALDRHTPATSSKGLMAGAIVSFFTLGLVAGVPFAAIATFVGVQEAMHYFPVVLCAGAVACVASIGPIRTLVSFLDAKGEGADAAIRTARACSSFAIATFGIIFCLFKPVSTLIPGVELSPLASVAAWFGAHIVFGGVLGLIFTAFLHRDFEDEKILTVVIGMVIFSSGLAYYLKLSPIFVCFVLGVVLANICRQSHHVLEMLLSVERPLYIGIFFLFGAWATFDISWLHVAGVFAAYITLRFVGRMVGGAVATRLVGAGRYPPIGPILLAPGALSAAMMLNFVQVYGDKLHAEELFLAILFAVVASEPLAYRFGRRWLIDATDVSLAARPTAMPSVAEEEE